jgi:glycosyltransferase involved in cell wall biosynthesis
MTCSPKTPTMASDVTAIVTCMTEAERPFIREALQSIQDQTVMPRETLIVVLESNTWIEAVVTEFPRMKVIRRPPGWEGAARRTAIDAAQTEFVAFLDGDDAWLPDKTGKQVEHMRSGCWDIVGADYTLTTEEGKLFAYGLCRYQAPPSAWMVRRDTMLRYPLDPDTPVGADWQWWVNTYHTVRKFRLAEPLMKYRVRRQSLSTPIPDKRRKLALSRLSEIPTARPVILAATYALYRLHRRRDYVAPKVITQGRHATMT